MKTYIQRKYYINSLLGVIRIEHYKFNIRYYVLVIILIFLKQMATQSFTAFIASQCFTRRHSNKKGTIETSLIIYENGKMKTIGIGGIV